MDGYRWYQNGTKFIPNRQPEIRKIHYSIVLETGRDLRFKKHAYFLLDSQDDLKKVLIHYTGDETIVTGFPHGNSKHNQDYHRTCPSVLAKLSDSHDLPGNSYKHAISNPKCPAEFQSICLPRDSRQLINVQQKQRQKFRLTQDAIYNLHEIAYDMGDFVRVIKTFPDLTIVCGLKEIIREFASIIQVKSQAPQLLSYDTTFQLGDFYLSPLLFRYTKFASSPTIPCLFLIHERKFQSCHEEFMAQLTELVPTLVNGKQIIAMVTDNEIGIQNVSIQFSSNVYLIIYSNNRNK